MSRVAADALPVLLGNAVSWVFICVTLTALLFPTQRNSSMTPRQAQSIRCPVIQNRLDDIGSQRTEANHSTHVAHINLIGRCQFLDCRILTRLRLFLPLPGTRKCDSRLRFQQLDRFLKRAEYHPFLNSWKVHTNLPIWTAMLFLRNREKIQTSSHIAITAHRHITIKRRP